MPGSKVATALGGALGEQKGAIVEALKPRLSSEKDATAHEAVKSAFDAIVAVEQAQQQLSANTDAAKAGELQAKVNKTKYVADIALEGAGFPRRYNAAAP
jgi:pyruvoyl-dependent arginine decarboxylase (PvlArgDC)